MSSLYSDDDTTGSINRPIVLSNQLDAEDLHRANAAMATALNPKSDSDTVAWENSASGAKGSFTPVAAAYRSANGTCRAFLAEIDLGSSAPQLLQGSACTGSNGKWTIRDLRPWKRA